MAASYILPSHPLLVSPDPLGVTDSDNPTVWEVITATIHSFRPESTLWQLPQLIQDLAYSVHGKGNIDTSFLRHFLASNYPDPLEDTSKKILIEILDHALALPAVFPEHDMAYLGRSNPGHSLPQKAILGDAHFYVGIRSRNPYRRHPVIYHHIDAQSLQLESGHDSWQNCDAVLFDSLIIEPTSATSVRFPHETLKCMLVASNRSPGFGSSCTQEELITGACPALLPLGALLVSPPVPDDAVLLAQRVTPLTSWRGRGRDAQVTGNLDAWDEYTFLLLDALELDVEDLQFPLLDLVAGSLLRELRKALTGFRALRAHDITHIASPLWGAGAFGGDPIVKSIILAMAGARAGVKVWLSVDEAQTVGRQSSGANEAVNPKVLEVLTALKRNCVRMTVGQAWAGLMTEEARGCLNGADLAHFLSRMS
ncbi:hypothetical protein LshimejAT787_0307410 [Lyophyllum shimeji]|uniref:PARG catalytic Macro domain-containing protein n=1 Tax=Lyophyllum shimeji TaxID=47721 RepID=A0A9P3PJ85_LYOSH|nr:hypothetical protein LshimejAT787_0307410 [Lyophyllum shimeji]